MNHFKCPACGGEQYTAADTAKDCIYCGNEVLEKVEMLNSIIEWDEDGYPTDESLEQLEKVLNGDLKKAIKAFYAALKENYYGDFAVGLTKKEVRGEEREVWEYHTFGWSGNEAIISTLSQFQLWSLYLERYDAGGHYYFKPLAICDNCGEGQECDSWAEVIDFMREVDGEWKHFCPECGEVKEP